MLQRNLVRNARLREGGVVHDLVRAVLEEVAALVLVHVLRACICKTIYIVLKLYIDGGGGSSP